jgi:leucyl aminopeptidase (aminopeptidase T)
MPQEQIDAMASTFTEGYRIGFVNAGIDLGKKKTVNIRYSLGFERIVKAAIAQFEHMGLQSIIYREARHSINRKPQGNPGYGSTAPSKQYIFDHREDAALYLDKKLVERRLSVLHSAYETYKDLAAVHAGPAVMEIFGETPFLPASCAQALRMSKKQQSLSVYYNSEAGQLVNRYIPGDERSFTIIAYPIPEIGENFPEIFSEIVKINTLDYKLYQGIQQKMIDALDEGESVYIKGAGKNRTDLTVQLTRPEDPQHETIFENCVADVNIPVGEVFTSPKLAGTNGTLHVSQVYLNELKYLDLELTFTDGRISSYSCANFPEEEENRKYIRDNVLFNHETLPMGEFAIGTNTTAYMVAKKYDIAAKLPILIAEKMGPHFAVGDTCFSWSEDTPTYNPDGKRIIAKDNECSLLRREDVSKAYFNCHTDITIPYDELDCIRVRRPDGSECSIIENGRFVLPGTEELNIPFSVDKGSEN